MSPTPSTLAQSKERKGSNFAIWQPCTQADAIEGRVDGTPSSDAKQGKISVKLAGHQEHCCWVNSLKFGHLESPFLKRSTERHIRLFSRFC